jgi:ubiquinone/menaquinone biosynthesis C-methylase UbiE
MMNNDGKLSRMYKLRFPEEELERREKLWKVLVEDFLQRYIRPNDTVLDLGGGLCSFINNIKCGKKYVVDLNPDLKRYAKEDVLIIQESADNISTVSDGSVDVVLVSNFFEHMKDRDELEKVILEIQRILVSKGSLLVIQPNIRYAYKEYWDFPDHYIPISHNSLSEMLRLNNFDIKACYPRFLPYRPTGRASSFTILLKIYLRMPLLWRFFGKQMFLVAQKLPEANVLP